MDITALLIDYLNKKYGNDAVNVLSENALYYACATIGTN